jgi:hypothetical protein
MGQKAGNKISIFQLKEVERRDERKSTIREL